MQCLLSEIEIGISLTSERGCHCAGGGHGGGRQLWPRRLQPSSKVHLGTLRGAQQVEAGQGGLLLGQRGHGMPAQLVGQDTADAIGTVLTQPALDQPCSCSPRTLPRSCTGQWMYSHQKLPRSCHSCTANKAIKCLSSTAT